MSGENAGAADLIGAAMVILGALLCLGAAVGLLRLPDVLSRMHAATKPQTLGLLILLAGLGISIRDPAITGLLVLTGVLQMLTAPISAHLVARTAYRTRQFRTDVTEPDELDVDLARAGFELVSGADEPQESTAEDALADGDYSCTDAQGQ